MRVRFAFLALALLNGAVLSSSGRTPAVAGIRRKSDSYAGQIAKIRHIPVSRLADSLPQIEEAINTEPERYEAYYYAAYALYRGNRLDEATEKAKEAQARTQPNDPLIQRLLKMTAYRKAHPGKELPRTRTIFRQAPGGYTSVIIDARGLGVERGMSPKIRRPDGTEIWGTKEVDPDYVIEQGIVVYGRTVESVKKNKRCGDRPLILKAVKSLTKMMSFDVCLTALDGQALLNADKRYHFLDANHVIILIEN